MSYSQCVQFIFIDIASVAITEVYMVLYRNPEHHSPTGNSGRKTSYFTGGNLHQDLVRMGVLCGSIPWWGIGDIWNG